MEQPEKTNTFRLITVWVITLISSSMPDILLEAFSVPAPSWLVWVKLGLIGGCLLLTWLTISLRPLRFYFLFLAVFLFLWWVMAWIRATPAWSTRELEGSWVAGISGIQALKMGIAIVILAFLFIVIRDRRKFFLVCGDPKADAAPVRWLGMKNPIRWTRFGMIISLATFFGGIAFLYFSNQPSGTMIMKALPLLPFIILISATNGLSEELMFRSGLLAPLQLGILPSPALWVTSIFFGFAHYSGTFPSGLFWVLLTGFLGYLFGKSMRETKGLFMPWLLHFISDIPVLFFTAIFSTQ